MGSASVQRGKKDLWLTNPHNANEAEGVQNYRISDNFPRSTTSTNFGRFSYAAANVQHRRRLENKRRLRTEPVEYLCLCARFRKYRLHFYTNQVYQLSFTVKWRHIKPYEDR